MSFLSDVLCGESILNLAVSNDHVWQWCIHVCTCSGAVSKPRAPGPLDEQPESLPEQHGKKPNFLSYEVRACPYTWCVCMCVCVCVQMSVYVCHLKFLQGWSTVGVALCSMLTN